MYDRDCAQDWQEWQRQRQLQEQQKQRQVVLQKWLQQRCWIAKDHAGSVLSAAMTMLDMLHKIVDQA